MFALHEAHPDYEFTLLVRNEDRARPVKDKYPAAKIVYGSLADVAVIEKAAAEADVVIRTFFSFRFYWILSSSLLSPSKKLPKKGGKGKGEKMREGGREILVLKLSWC